MTKVSAIGNIVRAGALSALMAGSVAMYSTNPVKTQKPDNPPQTEVVSKEGAEAVKAMNFQQQKPTVPTVHNKKLDETLKKFFDKEEDLENIDKTLNNLYNDFGTYMATAFIQQQIDYNMFMAFLRGDVELLKKFDSNSYKYIDTDAFKYVEKQKDKLLEWLEPNYNLVLEPVYQSFDNPPDAEEFSQALDKYVNEQKGKLFDDRHFYGDYTNSNRQYKEKLDRTNKNKVQKQSDYIGYQINNANYLLFKKLLYSVGINIDFSTYSGVEDNLLEYLEAGRPNIN